MFVHLQEAFVVDGQLVDRLGEVQDQAEDLRATVQLLHKTADNATVCEPLLDEVSGHEGVIKLASTVVNDSV